MLSKIRKWWNAILVLRVKHAATNIAVIVLLVVAFQVQNSKLNAADIRNNRANIARIEQSILLHHYEDDVHVYKDCVQTVQERMDLRTVLLSIADMASIHPESTTAKVFTQNQITLINQTYPPLDKADCGTAPVPPTQGTP
jgi:hypothetical protein